MTPLVPRPSAELSTDRHDPRDDWPSEARALADHLTAIYGDRDPLPTVAGGWCARQRSRHTRRAYARAFLRWETYTREAGIHPLQARLPLADAYASYLETAPTMRRVKGGRRNEMTPTGPPLSDSGRAQALSAAGSFYTYAVRVQAAPASPFTSINRPLIDPDHSPTEGMLPEETAALIETAHTWHPRSYALVTLLYLLGPRVDEILSLNAGQLGYDRGHRTLPLTLKGGKRKPVPVPPLALDALLTYLNGRRDGPLFATSTGQRWTEPQVWKHLRMLARRAGIPQANSIKPHTLRHGFITDSLENKVPLQDVQDAVGHADPRTTQRYNRRRRRLDDHPAYALAASLAVRLRPGDA
ncbi:tyrosine-type recombinase/integrase [Streptomyces aidingensis]|uniref:Site-specific recombinase XerD n=1 Tax=Streptomyces aidingensis TaxID=910347 RepID=A0A1I1Q4A9_9ACTN|nr:tyrosine-type recombinase/integrase [Streptomyces aidingensis]SFD14708.1 Site-specific recombinase XerD [Streptomyces aidingensis]